MKSGATPASRQAVSSSLNQTVLYPDDHEELHELGTALFALVRRPVAVLAGRPLGRRPHVLDALRLVPDLPVLDVPVVPVGPAAVVVAHRGGEDLRDLVEVLGDEGVEVHLGPRVLDRRAEPEEDVEAGLLPRALQEVVRRAEVVVLRVLRVEVHQREDVEVVAHALVAVHERPVVRAGEREPHRLHVLKVLRRLRTDRGAEA